MKINKTQSIELKKQILDEIVFKSQIKFGEYFMKELKVEEFYDHMMRKLVVSLESKMLGQSNRHVYEVEFESPLNWWQHLKLSLPTWFTKLYPVKFKKEKKSFEFNHLALMPDVNQRVIMYTEAPSSGDLWKVRVE